MKVINRSCFGRGGAGLAASTSNAIDASSSACVSDPIATAGVANILIVSGVLGLSSFIIKAE